MCLRTLLIFILSFTYLFASPDSNEFPREVKSLRNIDGQWYGVFHTKVGPIHHTPEYFQVGIDEESRKTKNNSWVYNNNFYGFRLESPVLLSVNLTPELFRDQLIRVGLLLEEHLPVGKRKIISEVILPPPPPTQLRRRIPRDSD